MIRMLRHLPNMLTGLRLAAAPATAGLLSAGHFDAALGVFTFAGASDAVDGFLAKRFGLTSRLGRFLDPAADKALLLATLITLSIIGDVPLWLTLLVVLRETLMVLGLAAAALVQAPLSVKPALIGKLATVAQIVYLFMHLCALAFGFSLAPAEPVASYALGVLILISGLYYLRIWFRAMRARPAVAADG